MGVWGERLIGSCGGFPPLTAEAPCWRFFENCFQLFLKFKIICNYLHKTSFFNLSAQIVKFRYTFSFKLLKIQCSAKFFLATQRPYLNTLKCQYQPEISTIHYRSMLAFLQIALKKIIIKIRRQIRGYF